MSCGGAAGGCEEDSDRWSNPSTTARRHRCLCQRRAAAVLSRALLINAITIKTTPTIESSTQSGEAREPISADSSLVRIIAIQNKWERERRPRISPFPRHERERSAAEDHFLKWLFTRAVDLAVPLIWCRIRTFALRRQPRPDSLCIFWSSTFSGFQLEICSSA